ncbi:MAG: hypothetical protein WCF04_05890 [Candidatus Nanopelagicales bacterium]
MATTSHGLIYPDASQMGEDADVPAALEDLATSADTALTGLDADIATVAASAVPIGAIIAYGGVGAPTNWWICDGSLHGSPALEAVLGSPNAPDLRDRFVVGAGNTYARGDTGGAAAVTLTAAQSGLPAHAHTASAAAEAAHTHAVNPPSTTTSSDSHSHTLSVRDGVSTSGDGPYVDTTPDPGGAARTLTDSGTNTDTHSHTVDVASFTSGAGSSHGHVVTVNAATAAAATASHENRPPYYALVYIIKKAA